MNPSARQPAHPSSQKRVLLLGATGTIGRATAVALAEAGHDTVCVVRSGRDLPGFSVRRVEDIGAPGALARDGIRGESFDAVVSCLASRTGAPADAWAVDHRAHMLALDAARSAGIAQFVLLSAICVQKPRLAFQHAKLAFEGTLATSGLRYSIVRPTAYFKSLAGQVELVRRGKPFVVFGDGRSTACKPIGDADLARYIVECLADPGRWNRVLPIGGPGPAITPREQGEELFRLTGRAPRFRQVPVAMMDAIIGVLGAGGRVAPVLASKAELARIGRYYATESMLVLDPVSGRYDADATPETGKETLFDYYARLVRGDATAERGAHAVF